jgi:hypothetical protein
MILWLTGEEGRGGDWLVRKINGNVAPCQTRMAVTSDVEYLMAEF